MSRQSDHHLTSSYEDFVSARWNGAARIAWSLTRDATEAEDLVAEAFARLWPHWGRVSQDNPTAYLNRSLVNLFLTSRRRKDVRELLARHRHRSTARDVAEDVATKDELRAALDQLSAQQRLVVVLRYVADMSIEEVAQLLGCSAGTVKAHTARATHAMRQLLTTL